MNTTIVRYRWAGWAVSLFAICAWAQAALTITTQPVSQYANQGSDVTFSVTATATSAIIYQWQQDGRNVAGANAASLTITNVQSYHSGTYTVLVSGDGVTLTSAAVQLNVVSPPVINSQPTSFTTYVGGSFSIYANVSGTSPLTYQWKKDGVVIPGATSYSYNVGSASLASAGSYTMTVTNSAGTVTTNPAVVSIVDAISITTNPTAQTVDVGGTLNLTVTAVGPGTLQYIWYRDGSTIQGASSATLTLTNVTSAQSGNYRVNVRNSYQTYGVDSSSVAVIVKAPPLITSQPQSLWSTSTGSSIDLYISAVGAGPLTYQWLKDGVPVTPASRISGINGTNLWITNSVLADAGTYSVVISNAYGSITSTNTVVTVSASPNSPTIVTHPTSQSLTVGGTINLAVTANGGNLTYQWKKNGTAIPGAIFSVCIIQSATSSDEGDYSVVVTNNYGSITSNIAHVTVGAAAAAPTITQHPIGQYAAIGDTVTLTVAASGNPTPTYQWKKDGVSIASATSSALTLTNVQASDAGSYTAVASNVAGTATSAPAVLSVGTRTRVVNLSTRSQVGTDANVLIAGFIINGTTPKKMLVRAVGPTLAQFSVDGILANPFLRIANSAGETVASNDDWGISSNLSELNAAIAQTGAFPLQKNSKDAALVVNLQPGLYTAIVSGVNNTTGVALAELYEVDTTTTNQLINISARAFVGTGSKVLIPGIVVAGDTPKKFLVRAVGPGLKPYGVDGLLANPKFEVVNSAGKTIAANDDWSVNDSLEETKSVTQSLNIFTLAPDSKDAAAVVTLAPGQYTVVVSGVGDTTGVALVELYQVP